MDLDKISTLMPLIDEALEDAKYSSTEQDFVNSLLLLLQRSAGVLQAVHSDPPDEALLLQKLKDKGLIKDSIH